MRKLLPTALHLGFAAVAFAALNGHVPILAAPAAFVVWWVCLGPVAVYATTTRALESPPYEVLPPDAPTNPESDRWGRAVAGQLATHGFVARGRYRLPGPGALDFAQRLDNSLTGEIAVIMAGWQTPPEGPATPVRLVVFYTVFRDGGMLVTTNSPLPSMTPDLPGNVSYRVPEVADVNKLYSVHKRLVKADQRKPKPVVLGDDPLVWERDLNRRAIAIQLERGLGVRDDKAGVLRLTFKGALRSTLLLHPRLARFQNRRSSAAAAAALRTVTT